MNLKIAGLVSFVLLSVMASGSEAGFFKKRVRYGTQWEALQRAGNPHRVARWARCSNEPNDTGYYVGGGAAYDGDPRYDSEGTWGWDYAPWYSRIKLRWFHGRRHQGGRGQYDTDRRNNPFSHFGNN